MPTNKPESDHDCKRLVGIGTFATYLQDAAARAARRNQPKEDFRESAKAQRQAGYDTEY